VHHTDARSRSSNNKKEKKTTGIVTSTVQREVHVAAAEQGPAVPVRVVGELHQLPQVVVLLKMDCALVNVVNLLIV